jgi:transcriptional regulator with XRE-family HTH domain
MPHAQPDAAGSEEDLPAYWRIPVGEVVRAWREARHLTQTQLAERVGGRTGQGHISQLETSSISSPDPRLLMRIAAALDISPLVLHLRRFPGDEPTDQA